MVSGRWAVVCYKDTFSTRPGFLIVPVGVAGLIEVVTDRPA